MAIIVAIYCNLHFWIVNVGKNGEPETWYMNIYGCDNDTEPIIIYKTSNNKYGIELEIGEQLTIYKSTIKQLFCFDNYDTPLKAISNYKLSDLENISEKIGINCEKKCKKQELYEKIIQILLV